MKIAWLAMAAVLGSMASAGRAQVHSETDTGSHLAHPERARIPDTGTAPERSRITLAAFARCTVDHSPVRLTRLLRLPASESDSRAWGALAEDDCLSSGEMRFKAIVLREAIFTELYRRRVSGSASARAHLVAAAPYDPASTSATAGDAALVSSLLAFAACVVNENRKDARAMVVAPTASAAQNAALAALRPSLGMCLPPGQQISLARPVLEGSIAEVLYREPANIQPSGSK